MLNERELMKYFLMALAFIIAVIVVETYVVKISPDHSRKAGLNRSVPYERQAQENNTIWDTQRKNKSQVPRH
jgi:hypothetical protein